MTKRIKRHKTESKDDYIKRLETIIGLSNYDPDEYVKPDDDADYSDDWMHPQTSLSIKPKKIENKVEYHIERQKAVPVTGNVAFVKQWGYWRSFDTAEERDEEYRRIKRTNPSWVIRKRDVNPYLDNLRRVCIG